MKPIYFDNNATTMVAPEVTEAMIPFFKEYWGNPSSMHTFGGQVAKYVDEGRQKVADMLNCHPQEIRTADSAEQAAHHHHCCRASGHPADMCLLGTPGLPRDPSRRRQQGPSQPR